MRVAGIAGQVIGSAVAARDGSEIEPNVHARRELLGQIYVSEGTGRPSTV